MIYGHVETLKRHTKHADPEIRVAAIEDLATIQRLGLREMQSELDECAQPTNGKVAAPAKRALAYAEAPAVSTTAIWKGQTYKLADVQPHTCRNGEPSQVLTWRSNCWDCGKAFGLKMGPSGRASLNRRCSECKRPGLPVQLRRAA